MPKVSEQYRIDRRETITAAASRCFVRKGVHQTSMADIIAESGLSAGAIYNHFRSKEEITVSVATSLIRGRLLSALQQHESAGEEMSPVHMVEVALHTVRTTTVDDDRPLSLLIMQFWAEATVNPTMLELMQHEIASIKKSIQSPLKRWATQEAGLSARRGGRWAEETAQVMMSMLIGFVVQRSLFPDFDEASYAKTARTALERLMS